MCVLRAALIKVCLAYEHGMLPSNLHYSQPNPNSESLNQGILKARARLAGACTFNRNCAALCGAAKLALHVRQRPHCSCHCLSFCRPNRSRASQQQGQHAIPFSYISGLGVQVVAEATPWQGGTVAISNFGFGGSNVHCLVSGRARTAAALPARICAPSPVPLDEAAEPAGLDPEV